MLVFCAPVGVLPAVQFNEEPAFKADKVRNIRSHRVLAPELAADEAPVAQSPPEKPLGVGSAAAEFPGEISLVLAGFLFHGPPHPTLSRKGRGIIIKESVFP